MPEAAPSEPAMPALESAGENAGAREVADPEAGAEPAQPVANAAAPNVVTPEMPVSEAPTSEALAVDPAAPLPGEVPAHSPLAPEGMAEVEPAVPVEPVAPAEPLLDKPEGQAGLEAGPDAEKGAADTLDSEAMDPGRIAALPVEPVPEPVPEALVPQPVTPEAVTPEAVTPEPVAPLAPETGLPEAVAGVTTNRLPRIDATPEAGAADAASAAPEAENEAENEAGLTAGATDARPLARFATPFQNPANKPLYAILLLDDGAEGVDRAALAALPLPLTIVLDPAGPEAGKLAAEYRKAGKEVAMLATAIPKGATPSDLQVSFEAHAKALPEAVAVVDLPAEGFQNNRKLAGDLLPVIKDQGRGLVTFDKGLNAGDQVARREGVPAALIFRELDAEGEGAPLIRRYLDRAAFKAVQDGRVAVLGRARPETIAALLEWSVEGRAGSVALAPLTAVLSVPQ